MYLTVIAGGTTLCLALVDNFGYERFYVIQITTIIVGSIEFVFVFIETECVNNTSHKPFVNQFC